LGLPFNFQQVEISTQSQRILGDNLIIDIGLKAVSGGTRNTI